MHHLIINGVGLQPNRDQIIKLIKAIAASYRAQTLLSPMVFSGLKGQMVGLCALVEGYIAYYFTAPDKHHISIYTPNLGHTHAFIIEHLHLTSSEATYA